jgi:multiple sugar transport system substrate-binding protein
LRISYLLAGLVLLAAGLGGCELLPASPEPPSPTAEAVATATPEPTSEIPPGVTQLVFWEPFPLDRPQGLLLGEMIRDFEAENQDLLIDIIPKSGYVGIHGAMLAALEDSESVELPDLAVAFPSMIAEYATAGIVAPLDPYLYDPQVGLTADDLADIPSGFLETGRFPSSGQQILAFPFVQNAIGMWVNETLLAQAGWDHVPATWGEFEQACFDVITLTGVRCYPFIESVSTFNAWLYSRGGRQLDEAGQAARFNGLQGVESMALLRRLMEVGLAWRPQDQYGDYTTFANGEAAFTFASTGNSLLYADAYAAAIRGEMPAFQWHQAMIPQTDPAVPATALYGTDFFIVRSDPERERAAWRFIHWFTDQAQTARWSADLQAMPVRISALEVMTDTLETYPFFREQVEEILPFARPEPSVAAELEIREILYTAILSITQDYADPQAALNQAAAEVNVVLSERP